MRVLKVPEDGPKRKLLDAAELLVSENGFDTVSVRDVTGAVKANVAAVNYHFGSREGLMDLLMMRLLEPLCEERLKALEQAEHQSAGKMATLEEVVAAYAKALPATASRLKMEEAYFLKIAGRILVLTDEGLAPPLAAMRENVRESFLAALARALPETQPAELAASWRIFDSGLSQSLVTLTPADELAPLISHWTTFGTKGFGGGKPAKEAKKDNSQGMLFDF
ncbi:MAG: TetR/AcrR family transcriptional regulator [Verrucomicrobia bacterium]|nr:TetR/AcrR family transcriptional regulator [Verrucomicrobiota bacterium]